MLKEIKKKKRLLKKGMKDVPICRKRKKQHMSRKKSKE